MDASLVISRSDKELARERIRVPGTHPLMAWCAGSNTVTDHVEVLDAAIAQIPARYRRHLLITVDGAGSSHGLVGHITTLTVIFTKTLR